MSDPTQPAELREAEAVDPAAAETDAPVAPPSEAQGDPQPPTPHPAAPSDAEVIAAEPDGQVGAAGQISTDEISTDDASTNDAESESPEPEAESTELTDQADEDDSDDEPAVVAPVGPIEELSEEELNEDINIDWYILKVQSNRERTSSEALKRKVAIEGLDRYFGEIIVPTEKVTEFKNGKKKTVERKIWPGYIAVQMHVNDDTWFAIRETSGIGDFTGAAGKPIPMSAADVEKILPKEEGQESEDDTPKLNIKFAEGDKVKVTDGNFENFEGDVDSIDQQSGKITVMISIFGRSTPVELEYWQVEKL